MEQESVRAGFNVVGVQSDDFFFFFSFFFSFFLLYFCGGGPPYLNTTLEPIGSRACKPKRPAPDLRAPRGTTMQKVNSHLPSF